MFKRCSTRTFIILSISTHEVGSILLKRRPTMRNKITDLECGTEKFTENPFYSMSTTNLMRIFLSHLLDSEFKSKNHHWHSLRHKWRILWKPFFDKCIWCLNKLMCLYYTIFTVNLEFLFFFEKKKKEE